MNGLEQRYRTTAQPFAFVIVVSQRLLDRAERQHDLLSDGDAP